MHREILTENQSELLPLIKKFSQNFYLVGGTAIALQLGHRRSIDFDLFTAKKFSNSKIEGRIKRNKYQINRTIRDEEGQFTCIISGVYITFFDFPYNIPLTERFERSIQMPNFLTLAAMKAFALGHRAKWKDYVDLYFIIEKAGGLKAITKQAKNLFGNEFNEKLFREQLSYFKDIDYREEVEFMPGFEVNDKTVQKALIDYSLK